MNKKYIHILSAIILITSVSAYSMDNNTRKKRPAQTTSTTTSRKKRKLNKKSSSLQQQINRLRVTCGHQKQQIHRLHVKYKKQIQILKQVIDHQQYLDQQLERILNNNKQNQPGQLIDHQETTTINLSNDYMQPTTTTINQINLAIFEKNVDTACTLINQCTNVDVCSSAGITPLYAAVVTKNIELITLLLQKGADPTFSTTNILSDSPIAIAKNMLQKDKPTCKKIYDLLNNTMGAHELLMLANKTK